MPPVLTKTWFHTGIYIKGGKISRHLAHEYYLEGSTGCGEGGLSREQLQAMLLDDTILPDGLLPEEAREACRSLKGAMLRQEVYALDEKDDSKRPYTVSESNLTIRTLQPRMSNRHGVFLTHARESVSFNYERKLYPIDGGMRADPRVSHTVTLEVDDYGNVLKSVAIGYGRRFPDPSPILNATDRAKQSQILLTLTENRYTNAVLESDAYRTPLPSEVLSYELVKVWPAADLLCVTNLFRFNELAEKVGRAIDGAHDLPFEDWQSRGAIEDAPYRRILHHSRNIYRSDRLHRLLPLGVVEPLALPGANYNLIFTPGLLDEVYRGSKPTPPPEHLIPDRQAVLHDQGGYVDLDHDRHWWGPSGRIYYSLDVNDTATQELHYALRHFFLPHRFRDPFENMATVRYDGHNLAPIETRDALANIVRAELDYRVLAPRLMTDPNGNRSQVAFDTLGLVAGTAVMGKATENLGDWLDGFHPDLNYAQLGTFLSDPTKVAAILLGNATARIVYDVERYSTLRKPVFAATLARETHMSDLAPGEQSKIQVSLSYSDGFSRVIQQKLWAEPGPVTEGGPQIAPRWLGSGWTIFNNKGKPVRQYEPFFSASHDFEFAAITGVSSILFYDPVERVVATLHPNHTYEKVVFDPWRQQSWDVNDTVLIADPERDPDVGSFFTKLPQTDYLPTWYQQRIDKPARDPDHDAALKAAAHANTPSVVYFDSLGRTFMAIADNGVDENGKPQKYSTRTELDIQGYQRWITDALSRKVMTYDYDMPGTKLHSNSVDAGERWILNDILRKSLLAWNSRGFRTRHTYDALRRPTELFVQHFNAPEVIAERLIYGETQPSPEAANLRGKVYQSFDAAGVVTNTNYDFKSNLLKTTRQLLHEYKNQVDWSQVPGYALESELFVTSTTYDALNRPVTMKTPDDSVLRPIYNQTKLLRQITGNLRGSSDSTDFVTNINYNAKSQRLSIDYGNGASTTYQYDPLTFRLIELTTTRKSDHALLQDLNYAYDPVGNITQIDDEAQQTIYFNNQAVPPNTAYVYDPIYRLIHSKGRELIGIASRPQTTWDDSPRMNQPLPTDGQAMRRYGETYSYDSVGNILALAHVAADGNWTRSYQYDEPNPNPTNNRLTGTTVGLIDEKYTYDDDGNMTRMPHLPQMTWTFKDDLLSTQARVVNEGTAETTYYVYGATGQRVRKATDSGTGVKRKERIYLGGYEIYREYASANRVALERETLHVMDDKQRVAIVDTKSIDLASPTDSLPSTTTRYQFSNHLNSSLLELDQSATIISYEEYYPYGSTSYQAGRSRIETCLKRYRYTGKERDPETRFYYYGSRYYAAWLGRWTSPDPSGLGKGDNLYTFVDNRPLVMLDADGREGRWFSNIGQRVWEASTVQAGYGFLYGSVQALTNHGQMIPSPPNATQAFDIGKGAGQAATGLAEFVAGGFGVVLGGTGAAAGALGVGVAAAGEAGTGGLATPLALPVAGISVEAVVLSAAVVTGSLGVAAIGVANISEGAKTLGHATSGVGTPGAGTPPPRSSSRTFISASPTSFKEPRSFRATCPNF